MEDRNSGLRGEGRRAGRMWGALLACSLALLLVASGAHAAGTLSGVVNVNTASAQELQLLPGVGEARARAIVTAREARGGFRRVEDLVEVKGIGDAMLERLRPFLVVSGKTTATVR